VCSHNESFKEVKEGGNKRVSGKFLRKKEENQKKKKHNHRKKKKFTVLYTTGERKLQLAMLDKGKKGEGGGRGCKPS